MCFPNTDQEDDESEPCRRFCSTLPTFKYVNRGVMESGKLRDEDKVITASSCHTHSHLQAHSLDHRITHISAMTLALIQTQHIRGPLIRFQNRISKSCLQTFYECYKCLSKTITDHHVQNYHIF